MTKMVDSVCDGVREALAVVRGVRGATPLERLEGAGGGALYLKREDVAPIFAYKWRGATVRMARLSDEEKARGVVAASAGNHAQGVALAASRLGVSAKVYMPLPTPQMKQAAVRRLGGDLVEVVLVGDNFDVAAREAAACMEREGRVLVHPYDDAYVIAGQGTIGAEIESELLDSGGGAPEVALLQVGGGGMAAGVGSWLRRAYPGIRLIGVEGVDQASMAAAVVGDGPVTLDWVDVFCDGTAVRRAGDLTSVLCRELLDEMVTVTNAEVCRAIRFLWEQRRAVTEPAGAMGVAAWLKMRGELEGKRCVAVVGGANMDFAQFSTIARQAELAGKERRVYRFTIGEKHGALLELLGPVRERANIVDFQYGKTSASVAFPVIGLEADGVTVLALEAGWREGGIEFEDVTAQEDVEFRMVPYRAGLFQRPYFGRVEFPERAGALADFMRRVSGIAGICYFNYSYTGERVGRALLGFEFDSDVDRERFVELVASGESGLRRVEEIDAGALGRILEG